MPKFLNAANLSCPCKPVSFLAKLWESFRSLKASNYSQSSFCLSFLWWHQVIHVIFYPNLLTVKLWFSRVVSLILACDVSLHFSCCFSVAIREYYDAAYVKSFLPCTADSWFLCLQNAFFYLMIEIALNLELIGTFYLWSRSNQFFFYILSFFDFLSCLLVDVTLKNNEQLRTENWSRH